MDLRPRWAVLLIGAAMIAAAPVQAGHDGRSGGPADCSDLGMTAQAGEDENIRLTFDRVPAADALRLYRATDGAEPVLITALSPGATTYLDETTENGTLYEYRIHLTTGQEVVECSVAIAAIPVFDGLGAAALAIALGALAYVGAGRRT